MCAVAVVGATLFAIAPLLTDIARAFGVSIGRAGLVIGAYSASVAVTSPITGLLAQRLPRARVMVLGLCAFGAVWATALFVTRFEMLLVIAALGGAATGAVLPAAYAYAGDLSSFENRARTMGYVVSGWSIAIVGIAPLMATIAQWVDWREVFAGLAASAFATALWLHVARKPAHVARPAGGASLLADIGASLARIARHRPTCALLLVNAIDMGAFYGVFSYLGSELRRQLDVGSSVAGLVIAAYGIGLAFVTFNGRVLDRIGIRRTAFATLVALGVLLAIVPHLLFHVAAIAVGAAVWGLLQGSFFTAITALATEQIPELRGVVTAILSCSTYLGMTIYTALAGVVFEAWGYGVVGLISAVSSIGAAFLLRAWMPARRATRG
jgi:predicted MFS family arabinose efflux permease